jgi:hypothetical protein
MLRRPQRTTLTVTHVPSTTLFRSVCVLFIVVRPQFIVVLMVTGGCNRFVTKVCVLFIVVRTQFIL